MDVTYLPSLRHVVPLAMVRRERRLPVPGTVTVRTNERVQATDVIAEAEPSPRHFFLDIARGLGVREQDALRHLKRERGDRVDAGEVIAGPVGITRRTIRAPSDGRIVAISSGRVLFESRSEPLELRAGFPGVVVATDGANVVTIETIGALIQARWGNGRQDWGVMRMVVEDAGERLVTDKLDIILRGAVLVAGMCDHPAPLHQATELSVRGMVLGSISSDLIPITRRLPYPILVTEGFGKLPISTPIYKLLSSNVGREVAVNAQMDTHYRSQVPELIIPLPATHEVELPEEVIPLQPGVQVRVIRNPYQGTVGVVRGVSSKAVAYPSGIVARSASVELEGIGVTTVPVANLEVLQ